MIPPATLHGDTNAPRLSARKRWRQAGSESESGVVAEALERGRAGGAMPRLWNSSIDGRLNLADGQCRKIAVGRPKLPTFDGSEED